jgi:hypothetical protein
MQHGSGGAVQEPEESRGCQYVQDFETSLAAACWCIWTGTAVKPSEHSLPRWSRQIWRYGSTVLRQSRGVKNFLMCSHIPGEHLLIAATESAEGQCDLLTNLTSTRLLSLNARLPALLRHHLSSCSSHFRFSEHTNMVFPKCSSSKHRPGFNRCCTLHCLRSSFSTLSMAEPSSNGSHPATGKRAGETLENEERPRKRARSADSLLGGPSSSRDSTKAGTTLPGNDAQACRRCR